MATENKNGRIAIVDSQKCKPKKCALECKRNCPVVRIGKLCIEVTASSKIAKLSEDLCIGCGICVKRCPFEAIDIINIPNSLNQETTHRYGANAFKLHGVPMPRAGLVLGLVGTNGIGKSTALRILANKLKPNLGKFEHPPDWSEIIRHFRGSEMQNFLTKMLENDLKAITKPQHVDLFASTIVNGIVSDMLKKKDERKMQEHYTHELELQPILGRNIRDLSGGELQRFALAMVCIQQADVYLMDEPSSFLDIKQRLVAAKAIRALCTSENYCVVVEHDLSVLDYLSDQICCFYGKPGAYGVVTLPFSVREGINVFLQRLFANRKHAFPRRRAYF